MSNVVGLFAEDFTPKPTTEIARFNEWWALYPRKINKAIAKAKYTEIVRGCTTKTLHKDSQTYMPLELQATEAELIQAVKKYVDGMIDRNTFKRTVEEKFIPYPDVWLNRGRFMDYID